MIRRISKPDVYLSQPLSSASSSNRMVIIPMPRIALSAMLAQISTTQTVGFSGTNHLPFGSDFFQIFDTLCNEHVYRFLRLGKNMGPSTMPEKWV
jgi:hypothetical protein